MRRLPRILLLAIATAAVTVEACRYSIRDTGFVDLGTAPYRLELRPGDLPPDVTARYRQAAGGVLLDANIELAMESGSAPGRGALALSDGAGRRLELLDASALPQRREDILQLMESLATSPKRGEILRESLRSFAVLVLVEGTDAPANLRARQSLQTAVSAVERLMPGMPKPVAIPPQSVILPVDDQRSESLLIWGLGMDPEPAADPRLAIVYGRGRRLGAPLEGPMITRTAVQERLVMIGQDCECDLDRAWLKGPVLPGRWDRELQEIAARTLGFDPENPMVRTEVSRIVLRGEGDRSRQARPTTALALGYTEESVDTEVSDSTVAGPSGDSPDSTPVEPDPTRKAANPSGVTPAEANSSDRGAASVWMAVVGGLAAAGAAGVWVARRGIRRH